MLFVLTQHDYVKDYWENEFGKKYNIQIVENMQWYKNVKIQNGDIFVLDLDMFDHIEEIISYTKELPKELKIIGLLQEPRLAHGTYLIKHGFKSYLGKESAKIIVSQVLKTVEQGNVWVYPELMSYIIRSIADTQNGEPNKQILKQLSPKEQEVAKFIADGYSNKDIADKMNIQTITVKKHLSSIFDKLHIKDRVSLAIMINKA